MEIVSFFRKIDLFGAHLINRLDKNQLIYRSPIGGFISFLIFSASLAYAIWVFYLWGNHQYTAKISSSVYASDFSLLYLEYDVIRINFWQYTEDSIDPFKEKILIPIITYTQNYTNPTTEILSVSNQTAYSGTNYIIPNLRLGFTFIDGAIMTSSEMFVQIVKCTPELLQDGEECAKQEIIDQFFNQPLNTIVMQVHYKQLDSKDGSLQSSVQEFLLQIETDSCYTLNTYLQTTFYEVRSSFLFGSPQYFEYINGALIQPQTNSVKYCKLAYGYEAYLVMYIAMKGNQVKTIFEYPTAGDLFANIGSIVSLLFMIRHFITIINGYLLNHQLIHQIISFYYPQFSQIRIQRNWRRQIKQVYLQNELLDLQEFMKFYKNIYQQITHKLTFSNLHYEISRIYIILKSLKNFEDIKNSHHIGISLDYLLLNKIQEPTIKSIPSTARLGDSLNFTEEDISILSLQQRETEIKQQEKAQTVVNFHHRLTM